MAGEREPKPVLGAAVMALALLLRAWALPLFVVGWLVGAAVQAVAVGFAIAWEAIDWTAGLRLRRGTRHRRAPDFDDDDFDLD